MARLALGDPHGAVEVLQWRPAPGFLEDLLQDAQLAVEQVRTGLLAPLGLVGAYVPDVDLLDDGLAQEPR
jgi:hypothetical protein